MGSPETQGRQARGPAPGATAPQKKMTSSLLASSLVACSGEGAGGTGGKDVPPALMKKASGGMSVGAGLGAGT